MMDANKVKNIVEACLLVAGRVMSLRQISDLFQDDEDRPDNDTIKSCLEELQADYEGRGIELVKVASGYRLQSRSEVSTWVARLFPEKPPRYSRALLETLVLVAYRQPITRGEIEEIRGVAVSTNIVKTLQERQWVKEVGIKDVPGKPALLGTTKQFLDYFNLSRLDELPPLSEIKNLDEMDTALMEAHGIAPDQSVEAANDSEVSADSDTDTDGEVSADTHADPDNNGASSNEETGGTVYAAGEAQGVEPRADGEAHEGDNAEATNLNPIDTDQDSEAVTFAGLLSSHLPAIEEAGVRDDTETSLESSDVALVNEKTDLEVIDPEAVVDQPDAEEKLLSVVSEFADEHKREIEIRDALESQLSPSYIEDADAGDDLSSVSQPDLETVEREAETVVQEVGEGVQSEDVTALDELGDSIDASTASPDVLSDTYTGESPSAGETLH